MNKVKDVCWFTLDGMDSVGFLETEVTYDGDYICPKCGKPAVYWEGVISHSFVTLRDIRGWSWDCFPCGITTGAEEF